MANMAAHIPFLVGIGVRVLSVDSIYVPRVKKAVRSFDCDRARDYAGELLEAASIDDTGRIIREHHILA